VSAGVGAFPGVVRDTYRYSPGEQLRRAIGFGDEAGGAGGGRRGRRTNPLNLKALRRADRRLEAFAKIAKRYVSPNAPQRVVRTKKRGR
jgi:hypothetical protein